VSQQPTLWDRLTEQTPAAEPPDAPAPAAEPRVWAVGELNRRVRAILDAAPDLGDVWVEGEVSMPSFPASGHAFFTLKDATSQLRAVMFREELARSAVRPEHGMQVVCHGRVRVYEAQGTYQLYVESIQPAGRGDLHRRYEELRARLTSEGLFAAERKRALPRWPRRIGVATSPVGAVWRDIGNVLRRRFPFVEVLLSPTIVQGELAAPAVVRALRRLYAQRDLDLIILARGGGSLEDLWPFNDERVVRCVADAPVPIVVGVGHESDVTLADFAADVRAPTPSAAAELAVPDAGQLLAILGRLRDRAAAAALTAVGARRRLLDEEARALSRLAPDLAAGRQRAAELLDRAHRAAAGRLERERLRTTALAERLRSVGPSATLDRGYAVARLGDGSVLRDAARAVPGEPLEVIVSSGRVDTRVERSTPGAPEELLA
jgi:exodeoxyribonuclease VII large subunit